MIKFVVLASIFLSAVFGQQCTGTCQSDGDCTIFPERYCSNGNCVAKLANGVSCSRDSQCFSGLCSSGACAASRFAGCQCTNDNQCATGACLNNVCITGSIRTGGACTINAQCYSQSCINGTCAASQFRGGCTVSPCLAGEICINGGCVVFKAVGESCGATNGFCNQGLYCDNVPTGVCRTAVAAGQPCTVVAGINPCATGLVCNATFGNANGTCIPVVSAGGNCTRTGPIDPCDSATACNATSGICDPTTCSVTKTGTNCVGGRICATQVGLCAFIPQSRAAGQTCDQDGDCSGNNLCFGGTCTAPAAAGTSCNITDNNCALKDRAQCVCAATGTNTPTTCTAGVCSGALSDALSRCIATNQCGFSDFECVLTNCGPQYTAATCCLCSVISPLQGSQEFPLSGNCATGLTFSPCCPGTNNPGTCGTPSALCTPPPPSAASHAIVSFVVLAIAFVVAFAF